LERHRHRNLLPASLYETSFHITETRLPWLSFFVNTISAIFRAPKKDFRDSLGSAMATPLPVRDSAVPDHAKALMKSGPVVAGRGGLEASANNRAAVEVDLVPRRATTITSLRSDCRAGSPFPQARSTSRLNTIITTAPITATISIEKKPPSKLPVY
jgi:hypothetical protein